MGETTGIEWTEATWNPWRGCIKVSPGCKNCYMYRDQTRYGHDPRKIVRAANQTFFSPLLWNEPKMVFTCSWSDFFIEEADGWRDEAWSVIQRTPHLTYQILTKRPENIPSRMPKNWESGWENVWLGVSVESQQYVNRIELVKEIPAVVHFISYEPALGPVDFSPYLNGIDWLISGGESGSNPRQAKSVWFDEVRLQCKDANVAFFHKQNGGSRKIDGSYGGKTLFGKVYHEFPEVKNG